MSDTVYDVVVLGAGPGGYPAAIKASQLGLKTVCVEKDLLGGVCLNWGCIPSKALVKTAELAHKIRHADDFGLHTEGLAVAYDKVIGRSRKVSERFTKGVAYLFKKYGVEKVSGTGTLTAPGEVTVEHDGTTTVLKAKHIVVATGARARVFPGIAPDGERILTYREAIVLTEQPESIVILGAGAIGMEFAYFMHAMGTDVTLVEGRDEVLPIEDAEVAAVVRKAFTKSGITVKTGTLVDKVERDGDGCKVHLTSGEVLSSQYVLAALGIEPNSGGIGLETVGVQTDGRGYIQVDTSYRTNVPGIYAVGDVADRGPALAHTATKQAEVCVERIAGHTVPDVDESAIPSCTYCQPQVASVGLTEAAAKEAGLSFDVGRFPFSANGRSQGAGTPDGFVKVLIGKEFGEILGAHIVGADATELIAEFTLARTSELTYDEIVATVHAHPTASEAMMEATAAARGESVHI